jgi:DNA repair protein RadC
VAGALKDADLLAQLEDLAGAVRRPAPARREAPPAAPADSPQRKATPRQAPALTAPPSPTSAEEHRSRLRHRLLTAGPDALADHELLEAVLFLAILRRDTKPIAYRLIERFGSFANAIAAPRNELLATEGMGESGAAALKIVHAAALRLARSETLDRPILSNWQALLDYLHAVLAREKIEQFRLLFLDSRNRLLADEAQARGTVNHTPVYPREVVKRALELNAVALILVHNHPSGDPTPSREDILMTRQIADAAATVSVTVHDHVIVGNGRWTSFRQEGLL